MGLVGDMQGEFSFMVYQVVLYRLQFLAGFDLFPAVFGRFCIFHIIQSIFCSVVKNLNQFLFDKSPIHTL